VKFDATLVEKCGSINEAKQCYIQGKDEKQALNSFSKKINELRKLNINPIILPKDWGIVKLDNLFSKIEAQFAE